MHDTSVPKSNILCFETLAFGSGFSYKNACLACSIIIINDPSVNKDQLVNIFTFMYFFHIGNLPCEARQNFLFVLLASTYPIPGKVWTCSKYQSSSVFSFIFQIQPS